MSNNLFFTISKIKVIMSYYIIFTCCLVILRIRHLDIVFAAFNTVSKKQQKNYILHSLSIIKSFDIERINI